MLYYINESGLKTATKGPDQLAQSKQVVVKIEKVSCLLLRQ